MINQILKNKHPKQLYILSFTEMWDRLGYYGTIAILVIFLTKTFHYTDTNAYALFGTFTTLSFISPLLGGILADRYFGQLKTIILGICLIITGNCILAFTDETMLYTGLAILICGIGLYKTNNVTMVGHLYKQGDLHKEQGFTILYVGMNLGAMLGPLSYGFLLVHYSFHAGFKLSIVGFSISLLLFLSQYRYFKEHDKPPTGVNRPINNNIKLLIVTLVIFTGTMLLFNFNSFFAGLIWLSAVATLTGIIIAAKRQNNIYRKHIALLVILNCFAVFYVAASLQVMSSVVLFIERCIDTTIHGVYIPAPAFASLDPFFIIILAMISAPLWVWLSKNKKTPMLIKRIGLGLVFGALGGGVFAILAKFSLFTGAYSAILILIGANIFMAIGELLIGPAIMAAPTNLLPRHLQSTFIGIYFLSNAYAAYLASIFAKLSAVPMNSVAGSHQVYYSAFSTVSLITALAAAIYYCVIPLLKKLHQ